MASIEQPIRHLSRLGMPGRRGRSNAGREARIWLLNAVVVGAAVTLVKHAIALATDEPGFRIHWMVLAAGFYVAELAVVHLEYHQDAHTFSMSEIPLLIGLFYASPIDLVAAMLLGSAAALVFHRRQAAPKLVFNLGQFAVQVSIALIVFQLVGSGSRSFGLVTALGAVTGILLAMVLAQLLVGLAIHVTGGRETTRERWEVLWLSGTASVMNAIIALGGVVIVFAAPRASWLAAMPPVFLYLASRGYLGQRTERARMTALFEATQKLLRAPELREAMITAGEETRRMLKAEAVRIILYGDTDRDVHYVTTVGTGAEGVLVPSNIDLGIPPWPSVSNRRDPSLFCGESAGFLDLDGTIPVREAAVAPLLVSQVPVGMMIALNRIGDITSFRTADAELLATFASQLAVCWTTGRLSETLGEVRETQGHLEQLVAAKDELIASVSHELCNPLTGVLGLARTLERNIDRLPTSESADLARSIAERGTELGYIIEDLLVQSQKDTETLVASPRPIDLDRELWSVVSTLGPSAGVVVEIPETGVRATVDPLRLRQIIRNLVTNAARYGGPSVWIEVVEVAGGTRISVCDDGDGVPAGMDQVIFEPYSSAHEQRDQPSSVGLGLAVSRKIARLMGGDLTYRRRGDQTVFDLLVPTSA